MFYTLQELGPVQIKYNIAFCIQYTRVYETYSVTYRISFRYFCKSNHFTLEYYNLRVLYTQLYRNNSQWRSVASTEDAVNYDSIRYSFNGFANKTEHRTTRVSHPQSTSVARVKSRNRETTRVTAPFVWGVGGCAVWRASERGYYYSCVCEETHPAIIRLRKVRLYL